MPAVPQVTKTGPRTYTPSIGRRPVLNTAAPPTEASIAYAGVETYVEYAAPAAFGDPLITASGGRVTPAGATPDARTIVARCTAPDGVAAAGAYGLTRIL